MKVSREDRKQVAIQHRSASTDIAAFAGIVTSCAGSGSAPSADGDAAELIRIQLDGADPAASTGEGVTGAEPKRSRWASVATASPAQGRALRSWTPLGTFRVNAILSADRFAMDPDLVKLSGKSEAYLRDNLFRNMSAIDFKGDGETGEYGIGYVSLAPFLQRLSLFASTRTTVNSAGTALRSMEPTMTRALVKPSPVVASM